MNIKKLTLETLILFSCLSMSVSSYAYNAEAGHYQDSFIASVVFSKEVVSTHTTKETLPAEEGERSLDSQQKKTKTRYESKKYKDTVIVLGHGQKFHIGWYEDRVETWRFNDSIRVEYVGGWTAFLNPYKITNEDAEEGKRVIWGKIHN